MPPTQSGRIVKSRKGNSSTPHQKNHKWESFTTKISKLHSLDPLRRVRRHDLETEDLQSTTSYFRNGIEKWADLNISKSFTWFRRDVRPFCDSLPQILHFEDKIMELLVKYISAHEQESLEPLLDLLTAFAHDLGTRFEKHYPRALSLITELASRPQDAAAIEWTFACLAFLFKYLSKLVIPDIRPTYDALAPLLGKARIPPHIARFAAEALSFLVKKAAAPANREKSLPQLVEHVRIDLENSRDNRQFGLYHHGVMTMFAEAIKGQGQGIHTTGPEIIRALIASVPHAEYISSEPVTWSDLVCGVLTSTIHHTTSETFGPISNTITEIIAKDDLSTQHPLRTCLYVRLLGTISGVRKGTRIVDWSVLLECLLGSLKVLSKNPAALDDVDTSTIWHQLMVNIAIVWQQAPVDSIIPCITQFMDIMTREPLMRWFIPFCSYFSELDSTRFRSLFLKPLQKFIVMHWSEGSNEDLLCVFLPRMVDSCALPSVADSDGFLLPQSWQDQIVAKFERLEIFPFPEQGASSGYDKDPKKWRDKCLPKYSALLHLLECTTVRPSTNGPIADLLLRKVKLALKPSQSLATEEARFIMSQGFSAYLRMSKSAGQIDSSLGLLLKAATPRYRCLTGFIEAMITYEDQLNHKRSPQSQSDPGEGEDPFMKSLIENLSTPSHRHRLASLQLLSKLDVAPDQLDSLAIMLQIEQTPSEFQNVRLFSVQIRKLATNYAQLSEDSWLRQAIPMFLFGQLTVRMTPVWDSAVEALQQISQVKSGEEAISEIAFNWIEIPSKRWDGQQKETVVPTNTGATDFECRNLTSLHGRAGGAEHVLNSSPEIMLESFEESQALVPPTPSNARSQALKVFSAVPNIVEKRSRKLVPHFLSWNQNADEQEAVETSEQSSSESWSLFDKKALLSVFAQFSNPKVLYQSEQVYEALLGLVANGDTEIQKSALKAILTWKQEGIKPYQENLEFLLDESRFKNELTVLFQGDQQIQPEHRAEIMPVLLRLLYGRAISKKGVASGRHGLHATRLAVLRQLSVEDMGSFLEIALGDLRGVDVIEDARIRENIFDHEILPVRKQVGFLNMMEAMINELGASVLSYTDKILNAVLYCLVLASRRLAQVHEDSEGNPPAHESLLRVVRSTSLKCLISLIRNAPLFDWTPYKDVFIKEVVSPRLEKLPVETTQGVSGTLQFISTLSLLPKTALFLAIDERLIRKLMECLTLEKTKDDVKTFALGVVRSLVNLSQQPAGESEFNELIKEELLDPNINLILKSISVALKAQGEVGKDLLMACIETVVELSPIVQISSQVTDLVDVSVFLLNRPSRSVNPKAKSVILSMLENLIRLEGAGLDAGLRERIYSTIATLFGFFKDRESRQALSRVLVVLAEGDSKTLEIATLCSDLNSYSSKRIGEPDYEKRLAAFNVISGPKDTAFTSRNWLPLIYNLIFHIKNDEEYGVLSANSADGICKFIEAASCSEGDEQVKFQGMLADILIPALHANAREPSETVRRETVRVFGFLVSHMPSWSPISDLVAINPQPDEKDPDPSFFSNVLSPATARQMRALQLLSKVNYHTPLNSKNLTHFFVPLLEHFIFGREEGSDDYGVGAQAATTIADIATSLEWPQYRAILRRYISYIESKPEYQKQLTRLLGKFVDALSTAATEKAQDVMEIDSAESAEPRRKSRLAATMPAHEKFSEDILTNILPPLMDYIHEKDEATVSSRVPVGVILVKILKLLPTESLNQKLPGVLTDICHILRSKSWDSREMARATLATMTSLLGPSYFGFVLKELRGALAKGYQLHVLSYTMHTILVAAIPQFLPGDLDYCLEEIVTVIMDDIFGVTGQEKDAEEYVTKMKEVKSSKSQDSMELIARTASVDHLVELIRPLQSLLLEKLDIRMVRKIDDLLSRIATGLLSNAAAESRDTLVFCYEVIQQVYESKKPRSEPRLDPKLRRYLIQKGASKSGDRGMTSKYTYKLVRFAVDVLRSVLRKHDSLRNAGNITGFIPILGDAVVEGEEEVKIAAFKLLTILVKVPFKTDDATKLYKIAAKEASKSVSTSTSTATDLAQSALKLISVILRDRRDVVVKDTAVDMLLGKVKDDLTEPLYRHVTFNFLRCILDRKVETAMVYDTLDYVGTIMITNDDKDTRDLARGAFFQFLRDYPQKKNRWAKQLSFIVANLKYEREGGRLSAMEIIHLLLMKSTNDFVQEISTTCFIPLVFVLANDDSEKCRLAAGELIKEIFRKSDKERTSKFLALARNWLEQDDNSSVLRLAIQAFSLYFEAREPAVKDRKDLDLVIEAIADILENYSTFSEDSELIDTVLQTIPILIQKHPATTLAHERLWQYIPLPLSHPSATVKLSSVRVLRLYLADFYENNKDVDDATQAVVGSHGLELNAAMVEQLVSFAVGALNPATLARWRRRMQKNGASSGVDKNESRPVQEFYELDETLAAEVSRVILMLSKFLDVGSRDGEASDNEADELENEDKAKDEDEGEEEWGGFDEDQPEPTNTTTTPNKITLHTLISWLSDILVEETRTKASALVPKVAALDILSILTTTALPPSVLLRQPSLLYTLLTPLHHLTDASIPQPFSLDESFKSRHEGLRNKAVELMDALQAQSRLHSHSASASGSGSVGSGVDGAGVYAAQLRAVRERARRRREGRSRKRKIEAVAQPERFGKWKRGKLEKKVRRRKEKGVENRNRRREY